jgi:ketosteroid isomerase-like protein
MNRIPVSNSPDTPSRKALSDADAEAIVANTERVWADRLTRGAQSMSELYVDDAIFFGAKPTLFHGREQIDRYFAAVPKDYVLAARFSERGVTQLSENVIVSGAYVTFRYSQPLGAEAIYRITLTLLRTQQGWKIAQHHASLRG